MAFSEKQDPFSFYYSITLLTLCGVWKALAMKAERVSPIIGIALALHAAIHGNLYLRDLIPWEKLLKSDLSSLRTIELQFLALNALFCTHDFKVILFFLFPLQCVSASLQWLAQTQMTALEGEVSTQADLKTVMARVVASYSVMIVSKYI
jgi:hypothetical protein